MDSTICFLNVKCRIQSEYFVLNYTLTIVHLKGMFCLMYSCSWGSKLTWTVRYWCKNMQRKLFAFESSRLKSVTMLMYSVRVVWVNMLWDFNYIMVSLIQLTSSVMDFFFFFLSQNKSVEEMQQIMITDKWLLTAVRIMVNKYSVTLEILL